MKAICVGHSTYDTTLPMNEYPTENIKYRIENHIECGGGPASNGAYLLAKWGVDTTICSVIGDDYYGTKIIEDFEKIGANTKYLEVKENHQTSSSFIIANMSNGSRTIITSKKDPIRKLNQRVPEKADLILVDGEHPETADEVLDNNKAYEMFKTWISNQGGDLSKLNISDKVILIKSNQDGIISHINALKVGELSVKLGAGRITKDSKIDYSVGIKLLKQSGDLVKKGDILAKLYVNDLNIKLTKDDINFYSVK